MTKKIIKDGKEYNDAQVKLFEDNKENIIQRAIKNGTAFYGGSMPETLTNAGRIKNRLKVILAEKDIAQNELAEKLNISKPTLSNIINSNQNATLETALDLAHYLKIPVERIFYKTYHNDIGEADDFILMLDNMHELFNIYKKNALTEEQIRMIYQSYVDEYIVKYDPAIFDILAEDCQEQYINNRFACEVLLGIPKS